VVITLYWSIRIEDQILARKIAAAYLCQIEAAQGKYTARRGMRFTVE